MKSRNTVLAVAGAAVLVLKNRYSGPLDQLVCSYAGNCTVSFALYFAAVSGTLGIRRPRLAATLLTLFAVSVFELSDGFGFIENVYDPLDLIANAAGIGLAVLVDLLTSWLMNRNSAQETTAASS
jgi:hypothetical protein